jgi:hypothetical protein
MNKTPEINPNDELEAWEMRVQQEAQNFTYPPTPDLARSVRRKLRQPVRPLSWRVAQAVALMLVVFAMLLAFPPTRAIMVEIIRIGAVRLLPYPPSPTPTIAPTEAPLPAGTATRTPRPLPTLLPTPLQSILDLPGETTLEEAQAQVNFEIPLPTYPEDAGEPDRVFLQMEPLPVVTLVWLDPSAPNAVRFALAIIAEDGFMGKFYPWDEEIVTVNGDSAIWLTQPHELYQELPGRSQAMVERRLVHDYVLVWVANRETYRLETNFSKEEAIKIAESLE